MVFADWLNTLSRVWHDFAGSAYVHHALPYALATAPVLAVLAIPWRLARHRPAPYAGVALAIGALLALDASDFVTRDLVVGVAALAAPGLLPRRTPLVVRAALATPGAWLITAHTGLVELQWARVCAGVMAAVGGTLAADFDDRHSRVAAGPLLLGIAAVGVYFTVPDTYHAGPYLAVAAPVALVAWPFPLARLGRPGALAAVGVLSWVVVAGGYGRPSSIIGGMACLGLLAIEPLARWVTRVDVLDDVARGPRAPAVAAGLAAVHLALVVFASRVAGLRATVHGAATLSIGLGATALLVALATCTAVWWLRRSAARAAA
jgi:hypothetical protein